MGSESLADRLADRLLDQVVRGELAVDEALPSEAEIAAAADVSRLTVREAVKVLRTKNIVRVKRGRGTYVNAPEHWTDLELILRMAQRRSGAGAAALGLLEVRRILEAGAAELCAQRRSDADLALLTTHVAEMDKAIAADDASTFARAETAFHETIVRSCGNVFIPAICAPWTGYCCTCTPDRNHRLHPSAPKATTAGSLSGIAGSPAAAWDAMRATSTSSLKTCCATSSTAAVSANRSRLPHPTAEAQRTTAWAAAGRNAPAPRRSPASPLTCQR